MSGITNIDDAKKIIDYYKHTLSCLNKTVCNIEKKISEMKQKIQYLGSIDTDKVELEDLTKRNKINENDIVESIDGIFDGVVLISKDGQKYPVPSNYASKSKLVPGDKMKLNITNDGQMILKLIEKVERNTLHAVLSKNSDGKDIAIHKNKYTFFLNHSAVLYYKGKPGDKVLITINKSNPGKFAALDLIMKDEKNGL